MRREVGTIISATSISIVTHAASSLHVAGRRRATPETLTGSPTLTFASVIAATREQERAGHEA
ncbi:hypothetical protein C5D18_03050 [Rathayibacter tritici]|nr:hypothetical protein C5D18_03050 [Rathayibacter tritici]